MTKSVVITLIGDDRPGIVESIASIVLAHQGDWIESNMANLSGKFAGILRVSLPEQEYDAFALDLKTKTRGLNIALEPADAESCENNRSYRLDLIGQASSHLPQTAQNHGMLDEAISSIRSSSTWRTRRR